MRMHPVYFELLRPDEITAERAHCLEAYQPIGPLEWHGPHLPLGTDLLYAGPSPVAWLRPSVGW